MNVVLEMFTAGNPDDTLDKVTFTGAQITYLTGDAQDLIEARLRQLPSKAAVVAALDGWSNGYVSVRQLRDTTDARITGWPVTTILTEPVGGPIPGEEPGTDSPADGGEPDVDRLA